MTTTENRPTTELDAEDLALIVEAVVAAGYGSQKLVQRKLRLAWDPSGDVLDDLAGLGILGESDDEGTWPVLVDAEQAAGILARLADTSEPDEADQPTGDHLVREPLVSLVKPGVLAVRPDDDLEVRPPDHLVWPEHQPPRQVQLLVTRARQATARGLVTVVDQPVVTKSLAVTRQAPRAGVRLVLYSPRGLARAAHIYLDHLRDQQTLDLLAHHAERRETIEYAKVAAARSAVNLTGRRTVHALAAALLAVVATAWWAPSIFAGFLASVVGLGVMALARPVCHELKGLAYAAGAALLLAWLAWRSGLDLASLIPQPAAWMWWTAAGLAVMGLGWLGRKPDTPLVEMPVRAHGDKPPALTAPMVMNALVALGNAKMKESDSLRLLMDPHRDGPGVRVELELPPAVTATWVMDHREELAGALRYEIGTVWPARGVRHPSHLSLYVTDQPMSKAVQAPWPLRTAPVLDVFEAQQAFTDQRNQYVPVTLAYASVIIAAVPRMGKSFILRELLLIAGMDVRTKVAALDGKGTGDFACLRPFLHFYSVGDDEEEYERILRFFRGLRTEMRRRAKVIRNLPFERCPDSKVTSDLSDDRSLGLEPIVVGVDETQVYFEDAPKEVREELASIIVDLVKRGPALLIIMILATQSVTKDTIPTGIANNAIVRLCLRMEGHYQNDRVLGTGAYKRGIDAQMFDMDDKGIAYLKAEGSEPRIVRSVFGLDAVQSSRLADVIRFNRARVGRLTGEAVEQEAEIPVLDIVADVAQVMREHAREAAQHVELVEWLTGLRPEDYDELDVDELSVRLRNRGVLVDQVKRNRRNLQGVDLRKQDTDNDPFRSYLNGE